MIVAKFWLLLKPDSDGVHRIKNYPSNSRFTWLALGDWGGWPAPINTSPIQEGDNRDFFTIFNVHDSWSPVKENVAASMKRTSRIYNPEYVVALGDNFYFYGVTNETDIRFKTTFEDVYQG